MITDEIKTTKCQETKESVITANNWEFGFDTANEDALLNLSNTS